VEEQAEAAEAADLAVAASAAEALAAEAVASVAAVADLADRTITDRIFTAAGFSDRGTTITAAVVSAAFLA